MRSGKKRNLVIAIVLMTVLIAAGVVFLAEKTDHDTQRKAHDSGTAEETGENKKEELPEEPSDILFFASDYQIMEGWDTPAETLTSLLERVRSDGKVPTNIIYCGDYTNDSRLHDYQLSPDASIDEIREIISAGCSGISQDDVIFTQGNHDRLTDAISASGLHEYDNYLVYVLNTQYDFPWKQGRDTAFRDRVIRASEEMRVCFEKLIADGETRPVIIAGHVPLHFTARVSSRHNTGDNMYASYIFKEVNDAPRSLDIVYLFGHDHSKGWDCYLGGSSIFKEAGETILIPDAGGNTAYTDSFTAETLNFTYMNAGYTGYYMNCGPEELKNGTKDSYKAADDALTATVCEIMPGELIISRYSADGIHPLSWEGEGDPYKGNIDSELIGSEYYSKRKESPVHIERKHQR